MAAARNQVQIDLLAKDMATRELDAAARTLQGLGETTKSTSLIARSASQIWAGAMLHIGESVKNFLFKGIQLAGDSIIGFNSRVEQAMIGFTTMLGSGAKAQGFMEELQQFAATTPFEFDGLRQSANLIMAMGFEAKEVIPLLTSAGDAVAALGLGTEAVQRVVYALGQMRAAGRVTGQDMMQLTSMGIPAWKMLADSMGVTVQEAKKLAEQGKIDAETAIKAITTAINEGNMGGMMAAQARTFNGAMSTIKDTIQIVVSQAFKPFFDVVSKATVGIADFLGSDSFLAWADDAREAFSGVINSVLELMEGLGPIIETLLPAMAGYLGDILELGGRAFTAVTIALSGVLGVLGFIMPFLVDFAPLLLAVAGAWKTAAMAIALYTGAQGILAAVKGTTILADIMSGKLVSVLRTLPAMFTLSAGSLRAFGTALNAALGPIGWVALAIGGLMTLLEILDIDLGKVVDGIAMKFGDMGETIQGLSDQTGLSKDEIEASVTALQEAYEFSFEEATYVIEEFGAAAGEMGDNVNGIMDSMGVSVGQASELAKVFGDEWEANTSRINTATEQTGVSWETMQAYMDESYGFLSATDKMNMMLDAAKRGPEAWQGLYDGYQGVDEATVRLGEQFELTKSSIDDAGFSMVESVKQTADGIVVTLTDGTQLVGATADEMMGQLTEAAQAAREKVLSDMGELLTGMSNLFETDESVHEAWQALIDRMDDPYTAAERKADVFSKTTVNNIRDALKSGDPGVAKDSLDLVNNMLTQIETMEPGALASGRAVPKEIRAGMDSQVQGLLNFVEQTTGRTIQELSLKEAKDMGLEGMWLYYQGMQANAYRASNLATSVAGQVRRNLEFNAYSGGSSIVTSWIQGMTGAYDQQVWKIQGLVGHTASIVGSSLPTQGPLTHPWTGGFSIIESWAEGMDRARPLVDRAVKDLTGAVDFGGVSGPGFGVGAGAAFAAPSSAFSGDGIMDFSGSGGGGGVTIINHFGAGSVRSDDDIHEISRKLAMQMRMETL